MREERMMSCTSWLLVITKLLMNKYVDYEWHHTSIDEELWQVLLTLLLLDVKKELRMLGNVWMNWIVLHLWCCIASNCVVILFSMTMTLDFGWSHGQQLGFWGLCCKNMTMKGGLPYFEHGECTILSSWKPWATKVCYPYIICHRYFEKLWYFFSIYITIDNIFCIFFWNF
jgi:hypothetical protein